MNAHSTEHHSCLLQKDADLFRSAKNGKKEDVLVLFSRHVRRFRSIVRRILARRVQNIMDPDDLVQDIAIVLLTRPLPEWIGNLRDFTRYISGIAKKLALAQNRKHLDGRHHTLRREISLASVSEYDAPAVDQSDSSVVLQDKEVFSGLHDDLPLRMREIVMWVLLGYSVAEVASYYDIDEETVIMFVCTANNLRPHPERQICKNEAMRLFKPARNRRGKSHKCGIA